MIIVKVIGGLGNQMFQVAFAKMLSLECGEDIFLDISSYNRYKIRNFSISNLNINDSLKFIDESELSNSKKVYLLFTQKLYQIYQKLMKKFTKINRFGEIPYKILSKRGLYYNFDRYYYEILNREQNMKCIYGYFQSEKYFRKYKENIVAELQVKTPPTDKEQLILDEINSCNAVGVSMRLGDDYLNSPALNVCTKDYYYRGMDYVYSKNKDAVFYIFSDDINRAKQLFNFKYPVRFIENFNDYESLRLLYSCKHFVISNSSFSWWGAYLANNTDKIVVAPNRWYNDSKEKPDIYYDEMKLLDV